MRVLSSSLALLALLVILFASANSQNLTASNDEDSEFADTCHPVRFCVKRLDRGETCDILPIRKRSLVPAVPPGSYILTKLRTGVWVYFDGGHQALMLKMDRRLAVIDFPDASVPALIAATEEILNGTVPKRIDMVYSHSHYDHIGGAARYHAHVTETYPGVFIQVWGTFETRRAIDASESKRAIKPNVIVSDRGRTLSVGPGLDVKMSILGGHTTQDLLLFIPRIEGESSVVMFVDVVFPRWAPFLNLAITNDVRRYIEVHEEIIAFDFDYFVGGHVNIGNMKDVMRNMRFVKDLVRISGRAIEKLTMEDFLAGGLAKVADPNAPEFGNTWYAVIGVMRKLQIDFCYRNMLAKWGCKLAGLDLVLRSHCFLAISYVLVDA